MGGREILCCGAKRACHGISFSGGVFGRNLRLAVLGRVSLKGNLEVCFHTKTQFLIVFVCKAGGKNLWETIDWGGIETKGN
jgi:hypothetical protein